MARLHRDPMHVLRRDGVAVTAALGRAYAAEVPALQKLGAPGALRGAIKHDIAGMKRVGQAYRRVSGHLGKLPYQLSVIAVDDRVAINAVDRLSQDVYTDWYGAHDLPVSCLALSGL